MKKEFPGPIVKDLLERAERVFAPTTRNSRVIVAKRRGVRVIDPDGYEFWDCQCDAAVNACGGENDFIWDALAALRPTRNIFAEQNNAPVPSAIAFGELLLEKCRIRGDAKVFFTSSGTESVEAAIKAARSYWYHQRMRNRRRKEIYCVNGFSGRTLGALSGTSSNPLVQQYPFLDEDDLKHVLYFPYPTRENADWLKAVVEKTNFYEVSHVLLELPAQGEGGVVPADPDTLSWFYEATKGSGMLWLVDAVQGGMGRGGTLFGYEAFLPWFEPDMIILAKALCGGVPGGALIARQELFWKKGEHSNTFGGGPLPTTAGIALVHAVEKMIASGRIQEIERAIVRGLTDLRDQATYPMVRDVRGVGAMWGVEFYDREFAQRMLRVGEEMAVTHDIGLRLLDAGQGKVIRFYPPLMITDEELNYALNLFAEAVKITAKELEEKK